MELFLKVLSDMDCSLYVDGEFVQLIKADSLTKISLRRGEYFIQCTSTLDSTISQSDELLLEYDRIYKVSLLDIILRKKEACEQLELEPRKNNDGLYGYYLKGTSKCIIPHRYEEASEFISLYAIVSDGETRSVIGKNGKVSIPFGIFNNIVLDIECEEVLGFHVYKKENFPGGWGYISIKYDFLTIADCIYFECRRYNNFLLCKYENGEKGDVIYSLQNGDELLRATRITEIYASVFSESFPILFFVNNRGSYGVINYKLDTVIPIIYKAYNIKTKEETDIWGNPIEDLGLNRYYQYIFYSNERFISADKRTGTPLGIPYVIRYLNGAKFFVSTDYSVTELRLSKLTIYREPDHEFALLVDSHYSYTPNLQLSLKGNRRAKKKKIEKLF